MYWFFRLSEPAHIPTWDSDMELTFEESHKRWEARRRKLAHQRLLDALEEAKAVANDPNAPTCTDLSKLEEFLLS